jgi:hypothetical protein
VTTGFGVVLDPAGPPVVGPVEAYPRRSRRLVRRRFLSRSSGRRRRWPWLVLVVVVVMGVVGDLAGSGPLPSLRAGRYTLVVDGSPYPLGCASVFAAGASEVPPLRQVGPYVYQSSSPRLVGYSNRTGLVPVTVWFVGGSGDVFGGVLLPVRAREAARSVRAARFVVVIPAGLTPDEPVFSMTFRSPCTAA